MSAKSFLTKNEQQQIVECVKQVETTTSGEIVPVIADSSHHYPSAESLGSLFFAMILALGICQLWGHTDMWAFLAVFLGLNLVFRIVLRHAPALKRPFIGKQRMEDEVAEGALSAFYANNLHRTRDETGIIIYVSVYERKVQVLADKGINDKLDPQIWEEVVGIVTKGIRENKPAEGICAAVRRCGELVHKEFPIKADDTDELPNLIIDGKPQ
jgi:putative membrane protein